MPLGRLGNSYLCQFYVPVSDSSCDPCLCWFLIHDAMSGYSDVDFCGLRQQMVKYGHLLASLHIFSHSLFLYDFICSCNWFLSPALVEVGCINLFLSIHQSVTAWFIRISHVYHLSFNNQTDSCLNWLKEVYYIIIMVVYLLKVEWKCKYKQYLYTPLKFDCWVAQLVNCWPVDRNESIITSNWYNHVFSQCRYEKSNAG